jgi:hypothetical protein
MQSWLKSHKFFQGLTGYHLYSAEEFFFFFFFFLSSAEEYDFKGEELSSCLHCPYQYT